MKSQIKLFINNLSHKVDLLFDIIFYSNAVHTDS